MRRVWIIVAAVVALLAPSVAGGTSAKPAVKIADRQPFVVSGAGFRSHERVRVTVTGASVRSVVATARGAFRVSFGELQQRDRCSAILVRATGSRGSLALAKLPMPMCMPQRSP